MTTTTTSPTGWPALAFDPPMAQVPTANPANSHRRQPITAYLPRCDATLLVDTHHTYRARPAGKIGNPREPALIDHRNAKTTRHRR
jgi:hypothetical protein